MRNGTLDGKNTVLCGGMAMRCLDSPRMSVFDGDTSSRSEPDPEVLRDAISYEEEKIAIKAGLLQHGDELITFTTRSSTTRASQNYPARRRIQPLRVPPQDHARSCGGP